MDRENRGLASLAETVRTTILAVWLIVGTTVLAVVCMLLSIVSRTLARQVGRLWSRSLLAVGGVRVQVHGVEKLDDSKRYVFVANHQSALDIPVLLVALGHRLSFIAKKELFRIPFFGWGIAAMGHIWIDRSNARKARHSIVRAIDHLRRENISLVLFPEGTRSPDGNVAEFKQGSFTLAIQSGVEVVPVAIRDSWKCLPKKRLRVTRGTIHVDVCDPLDVTGMKVTDKGELSRRVRAIVCERVEGTAAA